MGSRFLHELRTQHDRAIEQIRVAAADGDDMLVAALTDRLAELHDIAVRHGLIA